MKSSKVIESRSNLSPLSENVLTQMCDFLMEELGEPASPLEMQSLVTLQKGDYDSSKQYCLADPCNPYLAALSCIASAYRSPMVADSVLRDASRHVAEVTKIRTAQRISDRFQALLQKPTIENNSCLS